MGGRLLTMVRKFKAAWAMLRRQGIGAEAVERLLARLAGAGFRELYRHKFNLLFVNERL
jgi:hypothetical protein